MTKILVADDDSVMLHLMQTLMELEGNEVVTVSRAEDVLPAAQRESPGLIILDYHLAGGEVTEALVDIKQDDNLKRIPILVASGMDYETRCLEAGADGFILKPFRPAQVIERINQMIEESGDATAD